MNQLYLDLCKVKALLVAADGIAKGEYWDFEHGYGCTTGFVGLACSPEPSRLLKQQYSFDHACGTPRGLACIAALAEEAGISSNHTLQAFSRLIAWNDAPERTKAEVIDLVQRAADRASAEC
jgi:hypothetical protein